MHRRADVHDTALSWALMAVAGLRMRCRAHRRPFHRSASTLMLADPTAMHRLADVHDTASKPFPGVPTGLPGVRWMTQDVPFHRSASVTRAPRTRRTRLPTAVHVLAELHDTPAGSAIPGLGVGWTAQVVPFQRSASAPTPVSPTAVHAVADVHDTPAMKPSSSRSGTVRTVHVTPSHASASG